jgi:phenylpyruvate tautomerase PptA (4-oxalocrotonate tautomerase family)
MHMPMIDLYHQEGSFTPDARATLVEELTTLLLEMEGALDNPMSRAISWVFLHTLPDGAINVGGRPSPDFKYKCVFSVPEGTRGLHGPMTAPRRAEMFERATALILKAEGVNDAPENQFRVWCFLHEVPEGTWGGMGTLVRMQDISAFVRADEVQTPVSTKVRATMASMMAKAAQ